MQNKHKIILAILLLGAFFVRSYRTDALLRFYFDQGRDALIIHEMIHTPKPVLVGPTTGLAGILRGPLFYYLLLPGYLIGQGSPIVAAIWLQIINMVGLYFIYLSAKALFSPTAGLVAVFLLGFSNHLVSLSRWLSEPSLIFTTVPIMIYSLIQIIKAKKTSLYWPITALMLGLNLQLEIASEIWFIPAVFLFFLFQKKYWPSVKTLISSVFVFLLTLIPQVLFDFRHDHIMFKAIIKHFADSTNPSFIFSIPKTIDRWHFYQDTFATLLIPQNYLYLTLVLVLVLFVSLTTKKYKTSINYLLLWLLFFPLLVLSFYRGNQGNFYSYYLVGLFPIFIILVSGSIAHLFTKKHWAIIPVIILFLFAKPNFILLKNYLNSSFSGPENISFGNQLQTIDWVYQQAGNEPFNIDVYVPPVIPHAYDYLFLWYGPKKYDRQPSKELVPLLITLSEVDPPHPERLQAWMDRQSGIGEINKQENFGGIEVHRRLRLQ
ncbi:glycosyltransferase family 39 protein [Patescibacteria group bacterium]|nr:glycosyltransferase family 39 protein [Patescibacteria group bacterium]